jgi:hypothetical protein
MQSALLLASTLLWRSPPLFLLLLPAFCPFPSSPLKVAQWYTAHPSEEHLDLFEKICYINISSENLVAHVRSVEPAKKFYFPALEYHSAPASIKHTLLGSLPGKKTRKKAEGGDCSEISIFRFPFRNATPFVEWSYTFQKPDAIQFSVSRAIFLCGFALWKPKEETASATIKIIGAKGVILSSIMCHYSSEPNAEHSDKNLDPEISKRIQKFPLSIPLKLAKGVTYHLWALIKGGPSAALQYGKAEVTCQDLTVAFANPSKTIMGGGENHTNVFGGQFPVLYFK